MQAQQDVVFINTNHALLDLANELTHQPWIALDTEFLRERTYVPRLCLIQVGTPRILAGIDALAISDWSAFTSLLTNPMVKKVFHAARQDVEALLVGVGAIPTPIFDTQIVANLMLGVDQIGYAALVKRMLGISLEKTETRTDWSRRPLLESQWQYALDDVRYLMDVYEQQFHTLTQAGRTHWFDDDFAALSDRQTYTPDPNQAWRRIRDAARFAPRELAILQALAKWREETAIARDQPRRWVIDDVPLLTLAQLAPTSMSQLVATRCISSEMCERYGESLLSCIQAGKGLPSELCPSIKTHTPLDAQEKKRAALLRSVIDVIAERENVSATLLASRHIIEGIARTGDPTTQLFGWRRVLLDEAIRQAINS